MNSDLSLAQPRDWEKHLRRLKDAAKVAYRDTPERYESLFAEPAPVATHTRTKPRKAKGPPAGSPEGAPAAAPAAKKPAKRRAKRGR